MLLWSLCCLLVGLGAFGLWPYVSDDALISLQYARHLAEGVGLIWNPTDAPVEGFSNPLWVLFEAGLISLGMAPLRVARALSMTGAVLLYRTATPGRPERTQTAVVLMVIMASALPFSVAAVAGLETTWVAALALLAARHHRNWRGAAALAALALLRADGLIFVFGAILGVVGSKFRQWIWDSSTRKELFRLVLPACIISILWFGFRGWYYGQWLPNTVALKMDLNIASTLRGAGYVCSALAATPLLPVLALVTLARRSLTPVERVALTMVSVWLVHVVVAGGDFMPGYRFFVPALALFALIAHAEVKRLMRKGPVWAMILLALAVGQIGLQTRDPLVSSQRFEAIVPPCAALGQSLAKMAQQQDPLIAVNMAGCLPFFSRLRALDMGGVNDRHIARSPIADAGSGWASHERGDGVYVLKRQPDLVQFCGPQGAVEPCFASGKELKGLPGFVDRYRLVQLQIHRTSRALVYIRVDSPAFGVARTETGWRVQPWLIAGGAGPVSQLTASGSMRLPIKAQQRLVWTLPEGVGPVTAVQQSGVRIDILPRSDGRQQLTLNAQIDTTLTAVQLTVHRP
ncbi:MAG: hypothetical protein CMH53_01350 [Myxococcales bacterium]|nr:hypothetical protein [Myxococcales bacterium]